MSGKRGKPRIKYSRDPFIRAGKQTNLTIPDDWRDELVGEAHLRSYQEKRDISYHDLIRDAVMSCFPKLGPWRFSNYKKMKNNE